MSDHELAPTRPENPGVTSASLARRPFDDATADPSSRLRLLQRLVGNAAVSSLLDPTPGQSLMVQREPGTTAPGAGARSSKKPDPVGAAVEIERILDSMLLSAEDEDRIIKLLTEVADADTPGEAGELGLTAVFERLHTDKPSRWRMALHAPLAAISDADPTYYDLLFDRLDSSLIPSLAAFRDITRFAHLGSRSQMADQAAARDKHRREEKEAADEGWHWGAVVAHPLPRNPGNLFLAKQALERLAARPDEALTPEQRALLRMAGREGEDAAINEMLTSYHQVTPGEQREHYRKRARAAATTLLESVIVAVAPELLEVLSVAPEAATTMEIAGGGTEDVVAGAGSVTTEAVETAKALETVGGAAGPPIQVYNTETVGPAFSSFEEAFAAKQTEDAHILEVLYYDRDGKQVADWWEVSEVGKSGKLGHTEQKALMRVKLGPGEHLEMRGTYPPCATSGGCDIAMQDVANETEATITYRNTTNGAVREYVPETEEFGPATVTGLDPKPSSAGVE